MTRTMMQKKQMVIHEFGIHVVTMQDAAVGFTFYSLQVVGTGTGTGTRGTHQDLAK